MNYFFVFNSGTNKYWESGENTNNVKWTEDRGCAGVMTMLEAGRLRQLFSDDLQLNPVDARESTIRELKGLHVKDGSVVIGWSTSGHEITILVGQDRPLIKLWVNDVEKLLKLLPTYWDVLIELNGPLQK